MIKSQFSRNFIKVTRIVIIFFFLIAFLLTARACINIVRTSAPDFNVFWFTAQDLIQGKNPYLNKQIFTGLGYPANTLIFYLPLLLFPQKVALALYTLISLASLVLTVHLSLKIIKLKQVLYPLLLIFFLASFSFPLKFTLGMGQNNLIALLFLVLSFSYFLKKKPGLAGVFFGLAVSLKTIFAFFFLFYLLKKSWKLLLYSLIPIFTSVILVGIVNDFSLYPYWLKNVIPQLFDTKGRDIYYNQGLSGFIPRVIFLVSRIKLYTLVSSLASVIIAALATLKMKNAKLQFSLFLSTLLLVDSLAWQHHFVWLIPSFIFIAGELISRKKASIAVGGILVALAYLLVSANIREPLLITSRFQPYIISHVFFGNLILWFTNLWLLATAKKAA